VNHKNYCLLTCLLTVSLLFISTTIYAAPSFSSAPVTTVKAGNAYNYTIAPINGETISIIDAPSWLNLNAVNNGISSSLTTTAASGVAGFPVTVAYDSINNNVYVPGWRRVDQIDLDTNQVTTIAGDGDDPGYVDGTGAASRFGSDIRGSAFDSNRNILYLADTSVNNAIRKIDFNVASTDSNFVTTLASTGATPDSPFRLSLDSTNDILYFSEYRNIGKVDLATNQVTHLTNSQFHGVGGLAVNPDANKLYFSNTYYHAIEEFDLNTSEITTIAGIAYPQGLEFDSSSNSLYIADPSNNRIRKLDTLTNEVTTIAGSGGYGSADGATDPLTATFKHPYDFDFGANGDLYIADAHDSSIRLLSQSKDYTLTGTPDPDALKNNDITLRITDGTGAFTEQSFNLKVDYSETLDVYGFYIESEKHQGTGSTLDRKDFDKKGQFKGQANIFFNSAGFNRDNFHSNGSLYNNVGFNFEGNNALGFNGNNIHKDTGTLYDESDLDNSRFDANGDYLSQLDVKYDTEGYNQARYDAIGFNSAKRHQDTGTKFDLTGHDIRRFNQDTGRHETTAGYFNAEGKDKNDEVDADKDGRPNWQQAGALDDMDGDGIKNFADKNKRFARKQYKRKGVRVHIHDVDILDYAISELLNGANTISGILNKDTTGVEQKRNFEEGSVIIDIETLYGYIGNAVNILSNEDLKTALLANANFVATFGTNITINELSGQVYYDETGNGLPDDTVSSAQALILTHSVDRKSSFTFSSDTNTIKTSGTTKIGSCTLENNTRDGFELSVSSAQKGVLEALDTKDGEVAIPYTLQLTKLNAIGKNLSFKSEHLAKDYETGTSKIINFNDGASIVGSSTEVSIVINVIVDATHTEAMALAGDYTDTLTFTYQDL
jgi:hypothetical protein